MKYRKNTWNILWFDKILEILPEAKLVHIYRDPRDVITSFSHQSWMPSDKFKSAMIYRDLFEQWELIKARISEDSYMELSLESLVENPRKVTESICQFWQIPWNESLIEFDLSHSNSGRWRQEMSSSEQEKINNLIQEPLQKLGYSNEY